MPLLHGRLFDAEVLEVGAVAVDHVEVQDGAGGVALLVVAGLEDGAALRVGAELGAALFPGDLGDVAEGVRAAARVGVAVRGEQVVQVGLGRAGRALGLGPGVLGVEALAALVGRVLAVDVRHRPAGVVAGHNVVVVGVVDGLEHDVAGAVVAEVLVLGHDVGERAQERLALLALGGPVVIRRRRAERGGRLGAHALGAGGLGAGRGAASGDRQSEHDGRKSNRERLQGSLLTLHWVGR
ncbi:hypothetical protein D3C72_1256830 [compost metagenome]